MLHSFIHTMSIRYMHTLRRRLSTQSMTNQDRFNAMEHRNWEKAFVTYDEGFGPLTRQPIPTILTHANFPPADIDDGGQKIVRLLDVATGPGFVLSAAIDAALSSSSSSDDRHYHLTGLDVSKNFISLAEQRISLQLAAHSQMNTKNIIVDFVEGNAEELPFPDNTFDSITCNFGILHFFKPNVFLLESYRLLRPGGKICFTAWAPPTQTEGFRIVREAIAEGGNPNVEGLPEGPNFFDFGCHEHTLKVLRSIGFVNVDSVTLSEMKWYNVKNGGMLYEIFMNGTSRTREVLLGQTPEEMTSIQSLMTKKYDLLTDGGMVPLSMPAVVSSGQKPFS